MKYAFALILLLIGSVALAQSKSTVLKRVNDDGKTMKVQITVTDKGLDYTRCYAVADLSSQQKKNLVHQLIDSLGVSAYFKDETNVSKGSPTDKDLITGAVRDYVEALYEADTSKIERSVSKQLVKRGYYTSNGKLHEATMTYDELIRLTKRWKSSQQINASTPRKITVLDVLDNTASAKLEAKWGIDYFHLAKVNGKWMIMNVLWQEYPKTTN